MAFTASIALFSATTAEIERSEEPCAIATILMFAWARAEKKRAAIPLACFMPSPTTEIMDKSRITSIGSRSLAFNSCSNSFSNACFATSTDLAGTQKLILYSEEDCVIKITETPAFDMAEKTRDAIPTIPCIPGHRHVKHRHII